MTDYSKGDLVQVSREGLHGFKAGTKVTLLTGPNAIDIYRVQAENGVTTVMHRSDMYKPDEQVGGDYE